MGRNEFCDCILFDFSLFRYGIFNPTEVYDHLGEIFLALIVGAFIFCVLLYIKVRRVEYL